MKKMKKSVLKGFTLVELLVVMAIFSVLMAAALALTTPVSRMYKNTALAEKTYSYSHNIQEYLQGTLEYAESIYILTEDNLGTYASDMQSLAEEFRKAHYDKVVVSDDGSTVRGIRGKIYIMRLLNKPATIGSENVPAGQITLTEYWFDNEETGNEIQTVVPERTVLNPTYFNASDSKFSISYALGHSGLVSVPVPTGGDSSSTYKAIKGDVSDSPDVPKPKNLSIEIVMDKDASASGFVDTGTYRAFKDPVSVQIANLPLTNIITPTGDKLAPQMGDRFEGAGPIRLIKKDDGTLALQNAFNPLGPESGDSFNTDLCNPQIDFNNDIYFVFAYGDELR